MKSLALFLMTAFSSLSFAAGKDFIPPNLIITKGAMANTDTLTSSVVDVRGFDNIALQANYTGTATGVFYVDVSDDYNANTHNAGTWTTLSVTLGAPSGSTGTSFMDVNQTGAAYIRVRYTNASGSGSLNLLLGAKAI